VSWAAYQPFAFEFKIYICSMKMELAPVGQAIYWLWTSAR